ncbi:MAG: HlyD family efflux transporter periplasmic adaptor subunit [Actinomycetes bacterium]
MFKKRNLIINAILLVVVIVAGYFGYKTINPTVATTTLRTAIASIGNVSTTVSASGSVQSTSDIGLTFKSTGIVTAINVKVGDSVSKGKVLATIDDTQAKIALLQAQSAVKSAEISVIQSGNSKDSAALTLQQAQDALTTLTSGPTDATKKSQAQALLNAQNSVTSANLAVANAQQALLDQESTTAANLVNYDRVIDLDWYTMYNACGNKLDTNCTLYTTNATIRNAVAAWQDAQTAKVNGIAKDAAAEKTAQQNIDTAIRNQTAAKAALDSLMASQSETNAGPTSTSLQAAKLAVANAQNNVKVVDLQGQQALATQTNAQASLLIAQQNFDGTKIVAPASGTIAAIASIVGMNPGSTSAGSSGVNGFIILTNLNSLQIKASVAEADIASLVVGQAANITFDAVSRSRATGTVLSIAPLNNASSGSGSVQSYTVLFGLDQTPDGVKPGMTAQVSVTTAQVQGVLSVPATALTQRGPFYTVTLKPAKPTDQGKQVRVTVGLQGDSRVEIKSGIKAGAEVVLRTTTSSSSTGFPAGGIPGAGFGGGAAAVPGGGGGRGGNG